MKWFYAATCFAGVFGIVLLGFKVAESMDESESSFWWLPFLGSLIAGALLAEYGLGFISP